MTHPSAANRGAAGRVVTCAVAALLWLYTGAIFPGVCCGQNSLTIGDAAPVGLAPDTVAVTMTADADVQGFVLAIAFDTSEVSIVNVGVSDDVADIGAELVAAEVFETLGGFTLAVVLDSSAPFDGQVIPAGTLAIADFDVMCDAPPAGGPGPVTDLEFTDDTFNTPPLDNILVQDGDSIGVDEGLVLNDGTAQCFPPPPDSLAIESTSTPATECAPVRILLDNESGPVQGFVLAVAHEDSVVSLVDINILDTITAAVVAEFVVPSFEIGGGTLGVVLDFSAPFDNQTIPVGVGNHIANFVYCCNSPVTYPPGGTVPPTEVAAIGFADGVFGSPPLSNEIVVAGLSISPELVDGTLECVPVEVPLPGTVFACGVLDAGGNIVDPETTAGSTIPLCFFYLDPVNSIQGFQLALCFDCNLSFVQGSFDVSGTILEAVGAEFISHSVDNDPNDGDGCEMTAGILLDVFPPFEAQTVPATSQFLQIGCIDVQVSPNAPCNTCLPVDYCDFVDAANNVPIQNIVVINNQSIQGFPKLGCNVCVVGAPEFIRGDCNADIKIDVSDPATILNHQFQALPVPCQDACDSNDDGKVNLADVVLMLNYIFDGGAPPPEPTPSPIAQESDMGLDPTSDDLDCSGAPGSCP